MRKIQILKSSVSRLISDSGTWHLGGIWIQASTLCFRSSVDFSPHSVLLRQQANLLSRTRNWPTNCCLDFWVQGKFYNVFSLPATLIQFVHIFWFSHLMRIDDCRSGTKK